MSAGYCSECFRHLYDRPDSQCRSGEHTGKSQPEPWPPL